MDLGHVGIFRALASAANLDATQEQDLFDLLQGKAVTDIDSWVSDNIGNPELAAMLRALPELAGGREVLARARKQLAAAPEAVATAIDALEAVSAAVIERYPQANLYFDLSELRGYNYHTGIVFAAFAPGYGEAVANGGRYDHVGEVFGNARPATGFNVDITAIDGLLKNRVDSQGAIFAPASDDNAQWQAISALRAKGEVVVCGFEGQGVADINVDCDRQLVLAAGEYRVKSL
jgi:ATP phosphoribosyltransferase regulatory subunit